MIFELSQVLSVRLLELGIGKVFNIFHFYLVLDFFYLRTQFIRRAWGGWGLFRYGDKQYLGTVYLGSSALDLLNHSWSTYVSLVWRRDGAEAQVVPGQCLDRREELPESAGGTVGDLALPLCPQRARQGEP